MPPVYKVERLIWSGEVTLVIYGTLLSGFGLTPALEKGCDAFTAGFNGSSLQFCLGLANFRVVNPVLGQAGMD